MTKIVNKRTDFYDILICRPSTFGNPYIIGRDGTREQVIAKFKIYFEKKIEKDLQFRKEVLKLRGKRLGCFCKPNFACHGDVIKEWLDNNL
ncbi:MAG: DUF4326 domain-containing protein [Nanoarchaeota archaeon]